MGIFADIFRVHACKSTVSTNGNLNCVFRCSPSPQKPGERFCRLGSFRPGIPMAGSQEFVGWNWPGLSPRQNSLQVDFLFRLINQFTLFLLCPAAIVLGTWILTDYSSRPGMSGDIISELSKIENIAGIELSHSLSAPSLLLFFHPHCPCTSSTVRNLQRLSSRFSVRTQILAIAYCPVGQPDSWTESALTQTLRGIADCVVIVDRGGIECERFGVMTSGHLLLYQASGQLAFSGGITPGRGHEGNCAATTDLLSKINSRTVQLVQWPVYGCQIISDGNSQP